MTYARKSAPSASPSRHLTPDEADAFAELLNIAFGSAVASIAGVLGRYIELQVPRVDHVAAADLRGWFLDHMGSSSKVHMLRQPFGPTLRGESVLVLDGTDRSAVTRLIEGDSQEPDERTERAALLELANILVGACIGRFSELVDVHTSYQPPEFVGFAERPETLPVDPSADFHDVLVVHTGFRVEDSAFGGYLFLLLPDFILDWLVRVIAEMV